MKLVFHEQRKDCLKQKPDFNSDLGFGKIFTDYVFNLDYDVQQGWHSPRIESLEAFQMHPASAVFHYGQTAFEGLKAYKSPSSEILLFRPDAHFERLKKSCDRLCIPSPPIYWMMKGLKELLCIEKDWLPDADKGTLYIRPYVIPLDVGLGVRPAQSYRFQIILSPSSAYYSKASASKGLSIYVENTLVRAVQGGIGEAKTSGNYAASLLAQQKALKFACSQVLWLDAKMHRYVEEIGAMNIFFFIGDTLCTPKLNGSILNGITRDSVLQIAKSQGIKTSETLIDFSELIVALERKDLTEAFGTGTAAVISSIADFYFEGKSYQLTSQNNPIANTLKKSLLDIQFGRSLDPFAWSWSLKDCQDYLDTQENRACSK